MSIEEDGIGSIINVARALNVRVLELPAERPLGEIPILAIPSIDGGSNVVGVKKFYDEWLTAPERISGIALTKNMQSFVGLVNRHKNESSVLFGNAEQMNIVAVIDYHTVDHEPRFATHRVAFSPGMSRQWGVWKQASGKLLSQGDFAEFIEANIADLTTPDEAERTVFESLFGTKFGAPSDVLGVSRGLRLKVDLSVGEVRNLSTGEVQIAFKEEHASPGGGPLKIPGLVMLNIPVFEGGARVHVVGRLRYKRTPNGITWMVALYQPDQIVMDHMREQFAEATLQTGLPLFEGSPES